MQGPVILKDYVKSAKHDWDRACFVPEVSDATALQRVAKAFLEHRGEFFSGGFVIRSFEQFVGSEARTWWLEVNSLQQRRILTSLQRLRPRSISRASQRGSRHSTADS